MHSSTEKTEWRTPSKGRNSKLYLPRKDDGSGLISVEDFMELARVDTDSYVGYREVSLSKAVRVTARHRESKSPNEGEN